MIVVSSSVFATELTNCGCQSPKFDRETAVKLLDNWGQGAILYHANGSNIDPYMVAGQFAMSFYTPEATLLPTVSPVQRMGVQGIYDYFVHFLSSNPKMQLVYPEDLVANELGCGFGTVSGYYNFVLSDPKTKAEPKTVHARFTFIYEYKPKAFETEFTPESGINKGATIKQVNNPGWYIDLQQSSLLPSDSH